ncbi:hypothetical protein Golax_006897 [Gossypium laxum]|uniref:Uncharacterized protein n=2 Tax=Gossypium TaxID=3633 RepID=A0A7J8MI26_9ROSI|nr:hypothetical protein [Gossypium lobatum]MBA0719196.1 hypothetical protein [Gossypium laxum]
MKLQKRMKRTYIVWIVV